MKDILIKLRSFRVDPLAWDFLIFFFCCVGVAHSGTNLGSYLPYFHRGEELVLVVQTASLVLFSLQVAFFLTGNRRLCQVSLAQVLLYVAGIDFTFGFLVRHLLDPFFSDRRTSLFSYVIFAAAIALEIAKTVYLYRRREVRPPLVH